METQKSLWPKAIVASFAVIFAVNGFFIYMAVSGFDGLVEDNYYEKGLHYNDALQQAKRLGWKIELSFTDDLKTVAANKAKVVIFDPKGEPVSGVKVRIALSRPATSKFDSKFELVPSGCAYHGTVSIPVSGLWDMKVTAEKGTDRIEKIFRVRTKESSNVGREA